MSPQNLVGVPAISGNKHRMLSYDQALMEVLAAASAIGETEEVPLALARGRVLGGDVYAPISLPSFENTAVDGFAVRSEDTRTASPENPVCLQIVETIAAGSVPKHTLSAGQAARILTGAPLPMGADALVMVEDTQQGPGDTVELSLRASARYIRRVGSDLRVGALALQSGTEIDTGAIGLLAALGQRSVVCRRQPRVAVLTTGDEVYFGGDSIPPLGSIYDANGPALVAAVQQAGAIVTLHRHIGDDPAAIRAMLTEASGCDLILTSGGVSVGEYDYVKAAVEEIGSLHFWRIAIKPGKPLAFGRVGDALFCGLPGNPVSSLVTFELFMRPALRKLAGYSRLQRTIVSAVLGSPLPHEMGRREFVRTRLEQQGEHEKAGDTPAGLRALPLGSQDSHRLSSLASADALLIAHEGHGDYAIGDALPAILLN